MLGRARGLARPGRTGPRRLPLNLSWDGMTNRETAQALFLTENTIETHLRSIFRKLEIRSRSQLARAL